METRTITEVRVYILALNEMHNRAEYGRIVAVSTEYDDLVRYYMDNISSTEFIDDEGYRHTFKEGDLYNFNPAKSLELNNLDIFGFGIHDEWIREEDLNDISFRRV